MFPSSEWIFSNPDKLNRLARKYGALIILGVALILLLPGTNTIPLIDRDEPRFAEATSEMLRTGEWFVPYFNGNYRFDKPILTYWLMAPGLWVAQNTDLISLEMGARLHSILAAALLGLVVFWIGWRWFSPATGLVSGVGIVSCVQIIMHGRSAVADMPMVVCVALAQFALYELLHPSDEKKTSWCWFFLFYLSLGIGFLAKGPVTWLIPLLTLLFYRIAFWRKPLPWRNLKFVRGLCLTLIIVAAWGIPALIKTNGLFWQKGMGEHVIDRGFSTMAGFDNFIFYYLITVFISLFPWAAYIGYGFQNLRKSWNSKNAFLVSWIISTYLFFTLYHTQLPHYVMPAFAALFLLIGQLAENKIQPRRWSNIWYRVVLSIPFVIALILILFALIQPFSPTYLPLKPFSLAASGGLIGLSIMGIGPRRGKPIISIIGIVITACSLVLFGQHFRSVSITANLPEELDTLPEDTQFLSTGFNEPGVVFYSRKRWDRYGDLDENFIATMKKPGPKAVLLLETERPAEYFFQQLARTYFGSTRTPRQKDFTERNANLPTNGYKTVMSEGINPARTSWAKIRLLYKEK